MSYKLGFIADRVGVPSKGLQKEALLKAGVLEHAIYETIDNVLGSIRTDDTLYVYTTALFGRNNLNDAFICAAENGAFSIFSIKGDRHYLCQDNLEGAQVLADAWEELNEVSRRQMAAVGAELGGRKKKPIWDKADEIRAEFNNDVTKKELVELYDTSLSTINRILGE